MKVLIIGKIWPEPTSSAAGKRTLDVIESLLLAGWQLHFASAAQKSEYSLDLREAYSVTTHAIELNSSTFDTWIAELAPDIVIFDRFMTEEQFGWRVEKAQPNALRVIDTSDLHFLREARHQELKTGGSINYFNEIAYREIACILRSDLSLIISEFEYAFISDQFPIPAFSCSYWPFLIEPRASDAPTFENRKDFVMIGSFLHEPNWDAVRFCHDSIWPKIREALPDAELHVYGSYPPAKAMQLNAPKHGFLVKGRAEDAVSTLSQYRLSLAPLRFGAGLKGKLFDAFASGTPTVATPVAVEGVCGSRNWGSRVSGEPQLFAETAIELYSNKSAWNDAQLSGYTIARERFSRAEWAPKLSEILERAHSGKNENRSKNFLGQMLRYHAHRSTEFMSRWIEAKSLLNKSDRT